MHQPLAIADEEGMRFGNGEVVHPLRDFEALDSFNFISEAVGTPNLILHLEITCVNHLRPQCLIGGQNLKPGISGTVNIRDVQDCQLLLGARQTTEVELTPHQPRC